MSAAANASGLDEFLDDPSGAAHLPAEVVHRLLTVVNRELARYSTLRDILRAHLAKAKDPEPTPVVDMPEAARLLGRSVRWLHSHLNDLPPRRSLLGTPVWLRRELETWITSRPQYGT